MIILTIRTDKPEAELALFHDQTKIDELRWEAHRELGRTIHVQLKALLDRNDKQLSDIAGLVAFQGPGSFTGLRIGLSVANALAEGAAAPIVGSQGESWQADGIGRLLAGGHDELALPEYGAPVHITTPKH